MFKVLWFLRVSILLAPSIWSANLSVSLDFEDDKALFTYVFSFSQDDTYSSFSFSKPRDAKLFGVLEGENVVSTRVTTDEFIVKSDSVASKEYEVIFSSEEIFVDFSQNHFVSFPIGVDVPLDFVNVRVNLGDSFDSFKEVFPRDYILEGDRTVIWEFESGARDQNLFLISFEGSDKQGDSQNGWNILYTVVALILFLGVVIYLSVRLALFKTKKPSKEKEKVSVKEAEPQEQETPNSEESEPRLDFEDFLTKYLTENEQEVVRVIKENEGLGQNEILDELPHLTKSNLSKIITKLHNKKILKRIRVGKVNKIHLGERLEQSE